MLDLPYQIHDVLESFRGGEVTVNVQYPAIDRILAASDIWLNRMVLAILIAGSLVGSALIGRATRGGEFVFGVSIFCPRGVRRIAGAERVPGGIDHPQRPHLGLTRRCAVRGGS